jgi:CHAT domain-containing protein
MRIPGFRAHVFAGLAVCLLVASAAANEEDAGALEQGAAAAARSGELREAALLYREAADAWQAADDPAGRFRSLLRLGELERDLGRTRDGIETLQRALALAEADLDPGFVVAARGALGSAWLAAGDTGTAISELERAETLARESSAPSEGAVAHELGRALEAAGDTGPARDAYERAANIAAEAGNRSLTFRSLTNRAHLSAGSIDAGEAEADVAAARAAGLGLRPSHDHAYGWVRLGRSGMALATRSPEKQAPLEAGADADLGRALAMAEAIGDDPARSWALGTRAELRRRQGKDADARPLARSALQAARATSDPDAELRWVSLLGRIEADAGDGDAAIEHLTRATELMSERRVSRASAGPAVASADAAAVFLSLTDQLLRRASAETDPVRALTDRTRAQNTMERLKATELRDYFRDDCVDAYRKRIQNPAAASPTAAIVYPIPLDDRLELLVSSRSGIRQFTVDVPKDTFDQTVDRYVRHLRTRSSFDFLEPAQKLHAWLVAPMQAHLDALGVDTLVFVPGGRLRTAPMAALHDGERFLIERYALAVTPGLELTDPRPIDREEPRVFLGGLSESAQGFPALAHVPDELTSVQEIFGGDILLDDDFTTRGVERKLDAQEFSLVHIATHGEFGGSIEESFLVTHDGKLSMDELAESVGAFRFRERPLDLIRLSACETAAGDARAALGLAGVAVKSGARSAIGTLWTVNDEATSILIEELYRRLHEPGVSRARALQAGQRKLLADLRYRHPGYWAPFLLISNWL